MKKLALLLLGVLVLAIACGSGDFEAPSQVSSVRIFAARADKPYAAPGEKVELEVLAFDGRKDKKGREMKISWIPFVCTNPMNDAYYGCFIPKGAPDGGVDAAALDAGAAAMTGGFGALRPGVDLTPFLPSGAKYSFTMPMDAIATHMQNPGAGAPYGLAILFDIACAGHIEYVPVDPAAGPQGVPLGCFADDGTRLGAEDYVLGLTRVYAYDKLKNANPVLDKVLFQGIPVDPRLGIKVDRCTTALRRDCPELPIDTTVTDESWELNPNDLDPDGNPVHEQVWVDYYAQMGQFDSDARLLYDTRAGKVPGSENKYQAPNEPGSGTLFIVAHDNRGGAAWTTMPLHVR